jgi:hypothetical protein
LFLPVVIVAEKDAAERDVKCQAARILRSAMAAIIRTVAVPRHLHNRIICLPQELVVYVAVPIQRIAQERTQGAGARAAGAR